MSNVVQFPIQGVSTVDALRHCVLCAREHGEIDVAAGAQLLKALDTVEQLYLSLTEGELSNDL